MISFIEGAGLLHLTCSAKTEPLVSEVLHLLDLIRSVKTEPLHLLSFPEVPLHLSHGKVGADQAHVSLLQLCLSPHPLRSCSGTGLIINATIRGQA